MNILAVDDEAISLRLLVRSIQAVVPSATVYSFQKAREALELAQKEKIDIAFLDIRMRNMDGLTMAKELAQYQSKVNVIFCTGYSEYAIEALDIFASGYILKPVTQEAIENVMSHLRYPVAEKKCDIQIQCFGNFEVYHQGKPVIFEYQKTKELLAYLVNANGANCSTREIMLALFGDTEHSPYFQRLRRDLLLTLSKLTDDSIVRQSKGTLGIDKKYVDCDYYEYLEQKGNTYDGDYMKQYSFSVPTSITLK